MGTSCTSTIQATTRVVSLASLHVLRKFDWENSSLDDFKAKLASYWACLEGWDEWINNMFMASFGLWTHKDQINYKCLHYYIYEFFGLQCHMVLKLCKKKLM
jgi:hypothetical protein